MRWEHEVMSRYQARNLGSDGWVFALTLAALLVSVATLVWR